MDPVVWRTGERFPFPQEMLADLAVKLLDLSGSSAPPLRLFLSGETLSRLLSPSGLPLPALRIALLPAARSAVSDLGGAAALTVLREPSRLLFDLLVPGRSPVFLSSPLLLPGQDTLLLAPAAPRSATAGNPSDAGLTGPAPSVFRNEPETGGRGESRIVPDLPAPRSGNAAPPVSVFPAWIPGRTLECSVRWVDLPPPEERSHPGKDATHSPSGPGRMPGRFSFSLDIPWTPGPGEAGAGCAAMVRLAGVYDTEGAMTLSSRDAPDSFRRHFEALVPALASNLAAYPGIRLGTFFGNSRRKDGEGGRE